MTPLSEHKIPLDPARLVRVPRRFWPTVWITMASIAVYVVVLVVLLERTYDESPSIDGSGMLPQDVWPLLVGAVVVQVGVTGLLLAFSKANRQIGLGMFWGSLGATGALALLLVPVALTMSS